MRASPGAIGRVAAGGTGRRVGVRAAAAGEAAHAVVGVAPPGVGRSAMARAALDEQVLTTPAMVRAAPEAREWVDPAPGAPLSVRPVPAAQAPAEAKAEVSALAVAAGEGRPAAGRRVAVFGARVPGEGMSGGVATTCPTIARVRTTTARRRVDPGPTGVPAAARPASPAGRANGLAAARVLARDPGSARRGTPPAVNGPPARAALASTMSARGAGAAATAGGAVAVGIGATTVLVRRASVPIEIPPCRTTSTSGCFRARSGPSCVGCPRSLRSGLPGTC
ncbi:hypothetical protein GGQ54_002969 [Naumannella cuiyingiana]|uniref:Uncharacterized protein n=1 Tax=Naumannella cuiyingiana TaxID=1347891 RepID=A0A7Z0IM62_9ACTN|nr:hypothetical protein [Naumannella cuiyingiana]